MELSIHVLLVDNKALVCEGWANALASEANIRCERISTKLLLAGNLPVHSPDVLLLFANTFSLLVSTESYAQMKSIFPLMKTLAICRNQDEADKVRLQGVDKTILSPVTPEEKLIYEITGLFKDDEDLCELYDSRLKQVSPGRKDAYLYEKLIFEIFQILFKEHLVDGQPQSRTLYGTDRRDSIFFNRSSHAFWMTVKNCYDANQVVIENKNTTITKEYFIQTVDYLLPPLGRFGILTGRQPLPKTVRIKQVSTLRAEKLILFLCDEDIHTMLAYKAAGIEPSEYLQHLYSELVRLAQ